VSRAGLVPAGVTLLFVALVMAPSGCGRKAAAPEAPEVPASAPTAAPVAAEVPAAAVPVPKATITVWFPSAAGDTLVGETREIVDTLRPDDRGAQILAALLEGPKTGAALPAVPPGTKLRQLWIRPNGIAWADFSTELASGMDGGSDGEILAIYAIVDSLALNVPAIRRVGILVDGRERETLGGHVDLRRPLAPDTSLAAGAPKG
jgi:spore germination protein GerM